ncbi:secreted protein [Legionella beliardensis]|uniref:Secreted protein n=1 Tax=Legionella beliardensis TaxID=91822 RepID=A0A378I1K9_9GAMM|nr:protease inhibitor I42 family protein [Legionella beliardensis]STX29078.1 secreted protein [Legionella beliardensis]
MKVIGGSLLFFIVAITYAADNPMVIHLKPTDTHFQVILPANQTTGFEWTLHTYDKSLLRLVSSQFNAPHSKLMGVPGTTVFNFQVIPGAITPRVTALVFSYARPWTTQNETFQTVTVHFRDTPVIGQ